MTIRNLLNLTVSLGMLSIVLKSAYLAYLGLSYGMVKEAVVGLVASLAIAFMLLMFAVINHLYKPEKKRGNG